MTNLFSTADEFSLLGEKLPAFDEAQAEAGRTRQAQLTKPAGSLGRLEDIAVQFCGWQQKVKPSADKVQTVIFAGNHGVVEQGVSAFPAVVTAQMVGNFSAGGAAINQLCKANASNLRVIPLSLEKPTVDFTQGPAMSESETLEAFNIGAEAVERDTNVLIVGEMGIGNTTVAAALTYAICGGQAEDWVGYGTGIDDTTWRRKRDVVEKAVTLHKDKTNDTLSLLSRLGGRELAAMAGAIAAARTYRIPVILDGYVVTAAAATLFKNSPDWLAHCIAGHTSVEPGHRKLLSFLKLEPLLDLGMRLGEGSGAQVALSIVRAALATHNGMATFEEAMVASKGAS